MLTGTGRSCWARESCLSWHFFSRSTLTSVCRSAGCRGCRYPRSVSAAPGLGVNCPACGLTRSLILLARGNLEGSWRAHHLGWLLGGLVLLQLPYRWLALRQHERPHLPSWIELWLGFALPMLLLANWTIDIGGCEGASPVQGVFVSAQRSKGTGDFCVSTGSIRSLFGRLGPSASPAMRLKSQPEMVRLHDRCKS